MLVVNGNGIYLIFHFPCIMLNDKCILLFLRFFIEFVVTMDAIEFLQKRFVCGARKTEIEKYSSENARTRKKPESDARHSLA